MLNKNSFECLILAGGYGTRLEKINPSRPKPMISVLHKPFLHYQLNFLKNSGIKNILISTGFLGDQIKSYIDHTEIPNLSITCLQENKPLGTGGAIKNVIEYLKDDFVVCNGDTIAMFSLPEMIDFHKAKNALLTMLIKKIPHSSRYGSVKLSPNNQILEFQKKSNIKNAWISAGFFIFKKTCIPWNEYPESFAYEDVLFPHLIKTNRTYGYLFNDYFIDIGTPESFSQFINDISDKNYFKILFD